VDGCVGDLPEAIGDERVTVVDELEMVEDIQLEIEVIAAVDVRRGAQRARTEARARPVGGAVVPGSPDDGSVGAPLVELLGLCQQRSPAEGCHPCQRLAVDWARIPGESSRRGASSGWSATAARLPDGRLLRRAFDYAAGDTRLARQMMRRLSTQKGVHVTRVRSCPDVGTSWVTRLGSRVHLPVTL